MNRLKLFTAVIAIVALPAGVFGEPKHEKDLKSKVKDKAKKEKSVPAPPTLVLIGAAAGVAGLLRFRERRRSSLIRHSPLTAQASHTDDSRPALPRGGESVAIARALAVVPDHASDTTSVASAVGGETVDLRASRRPTTATRERMAWPDTLDLDAEPEPPDR